MKKVIFGLVGEIAAGKTTVTDYLKENHGAVSFRFSDMLRDILDRIHVEHSRTHLQDLSTFLRERFGSDIMSKVLAKDVDESGAPLIITEGIRRPSDIAYLRQNEHFNLIAIETDERTRFERLTQRSENPDDAHKTWEEFRADGQKEPEQKIREAMDRADFTIDNNGTLESLYKQVEHILREGKASRGMA